MSYDKIELPSAGEKISMGPDGQLSVPNNPVIPFIEGDGVGPTPATVKAGAIRARRRTEVSSVATTEERPATEEVTPAAEESAARFRRCCRPIRSPATEPRSSRG